VRETPGYAVSSFKGEEQAVAHPGTEKPASPPYRRTAVPASLADAAGELLA
jgi:hypothetical protein